MTEPTARRHDGGRYQLSIPLDASAIPDRPRDVALKVLARVRGGKSVSQKVTLDANGTGTATFSFEKPPGALDVFVGPGDAGDEELLQLQTLHLPVPGRRWGRDPLLFLPPLCIPPYYWHWWLFWCRRFVIRGRVFCPDGSPVPGAQVCAYDVDTFFFWSSTQLIGCATTDVTGSFEISFRWCCGWWPWWWWRLRVWRLNPILDRYIAEALRRHPGLHLGPIGGDRPNLSTFAPLLGGGVSGSLERVLETDVALLERTRERLVERLPSMPELERLRLWPWFPWRPWWDCAPDVIFKVTQNCFGTNVVIIDEDVGDTRWNIPTVSNFPLVAGPGACCIPHCPPPRDCIEGECVVIDTVCGSPIANIGGNLGAPPAPVGYLAPGAVPLNATGHHRPFAGSVPVDKNPGDLTGVDYLEFEFSDDGGATWQLLPAGRGEDFQRSYWDLATSPPSVAVDFKFDSTSFPGRTVLETREHRENAIGGFGVARVWLSTNFSLLISIDSTKFDDGTYHFRAVGWDDGGGGNLVNRRVLPVCGRNIANDLVLTFDNRGFSTAAHAPAHLCGGVHLCTEEPDTHIAAVRIDGVDVGPCDTVDSSKGVLEIEFLVTDTASTGGTRHLDFYTLEAHWGLNQSQSLLALPGANVTSLSGDPTGWLLGQSSGNYGTALSQGAAAPDWGGGRYLLRVPASQAFPEPCCYELVLEGQKRTVAHCTALHTNRTEFTLGVGVCPQPPNLSHSADAPPVPLVNPLTGAVR
jgi:hypothetical protein